MTEILSTFHVGKIESKCFHFCGKDVHQDDDYNVVVSCKEATLKLKKLPRPAGVKPIDPINADGKRQLRFFAGAMS